METASDRIVVHWKNFRNISVSLMLTRVLRQLSYLNARVRMVMGWTCGGKVADCPPSQPHPIRSRPLWRLYYYPPTFWLATDARISRLNAFVPTSPACNNKKNSTIKFVALESRWMYMVFIIIKWMCVCCGACIMYEIVFRRTNST